MNVIKLLLNGCQMDVLHKEWFGPQNREIIIQCAPNAISAKVDR